CNQCPLYPRKRTLELSLRMSALCQMRTHAPQQKFCHLARAQRQRPAVLTRLLHLSARVYRPFPRPIRQNNVVIEFLMLATKGAVLTTGGAMMAMMTGRIATASAIAFLFTASIVAAQAPASVRVRATIASVDSGILTAKARDGGEMKIKLADNAPVNEVVR